MSTSDDPSAQRFSEQELALILHRAAEAQVRRQHPEEGGYSLAEIQSLAAEAGISPQLIEEAASTVRLEQEATASPYATTTRIDRVVEGEVPSVDFVELVDIVRMHSDLPGQTSTDHGRLEWRATDGVGTTILTVTPRAGKTRIALRMTPSELILATMGTSFGLGFVSFIVAAFLLKAGDYDRGARVLGGMAFGAGGLVAGAFIGLRHFGRKWRARARAVADELTATAREIVSRGKGA